MIALLRNPVERAYSNWLHNVRNGRERFGFWDALQTEDLRIEEGAGYAFWYRNKGLYHEHLTRYFGLFSRDQLRVHLFEDLKRDPQALVTDIFGFLGVEEEFQPKLERHNISGLPRGRIGKFYNRVRKNAIALSIAKQVAPESICIRLRERFLIKPELPQGINSTLIEEYRSDILRLETLIDRDLSSWYL